MYFVWQERNKRQFTSEKRTGTHLLKAILGTIRLRLASVKFMQIPYVDMVANEWGVKFRYVQRNTRDLGSFGEETDKTTKSTPKSLEEVYTMPGDGVTNPCDSALLEDLALYDFESWNDPRDFAKQVKAISLPQDVPSTSDHRLIELENQVQRLMEVNHDPKSSVQVNKITSSCEIYSSPHNTQYCMENPEQAFVDYASLCTDEAGGKWFTFKPEQNNLGDIYNPSWKSHPNLREEQEEKGDPENINTDPPSPPDSSISLITEKEDDEDVMFIEIIKKYDDSRKEELEKDENAVTRGLEVEYFDIFPTRSELAYHKYLMSGPIPYLFLNPIVIGGCPSSLKIPCNIGHVHMEKSYIDLNSPLNIMTRMLYNWIMRKKLEPREDPNGVKWMSNFTGRIKGMDIFVGNFTYVTDFMIVEDISSIIDPRLSQVVLWKPFVEISTWLMTYLIEYIWMAFGGNTLDLGSFGEETDKTANSTPKPFEEVCTVPGGGVANPYDGVRICKRRRQDSYDGVRT
ncbi:hypothetical protein Tco_0183783 [Tanacetum coccineum]